MTNEKTSPEKAEPVAAEAGSEPAAAEAKAEPAAAEAEKPKLVSFKEFLEDVPPSHQREVSGVWVGGTIYSTQIVIKTTKPELDLPCTNDRCRGIRVFRTDEDFQLTKDSWETVFITFTCSNCNQVEKRYSLVILLGEGPKGMASCYKFGEMPSFGTPTPTRLLKLIEPDKEVFFKGRQCENHGLGIGAFAYYRRVVEDQKNRILDRIINAAETLFAPQDMIDTLTSAKDEHQFQKALDSVKDAVPPGLLINGQNPLTLLHSALSDGLHGKSYQFAIYRLSAIHGKAVMDWTVSVFSS